MLARLWLAEDPRRSAAAIAHPPGNINAGACVPNRSFIAPMIVGPTRLPIFAIVTTMAIPAAAGAPALHSP
jgi:hypothetical protein